MRVSAGERNGNVYRLNINVASRPFQNFLLLYFFTGLLVVSLAAFTVYNLFRVADVFLETSRFLDPVI